MKYVIAFKKSHTLFDNTAIMASEPIESFGIDTFTEWRSESPFPLINQNPNEGDCRSEDPEDPEDFEDFEDFDDFDNSRAGERDHQFQSMESEVIVHVQDKETFSLLKNNLVSRLCYYMTASSSQVMILFHKFTAFISDHIAVVTADLLHQYLIHLRNRFTKLYATEKKSIDDVEGRVGLAMIILDV